MKLGDEEVARLDAYWRAANYLSVGQIYLLDNPLLRERDSMGEGEGRTKLSINPMQHLKPVISPFFAHLGSMTEADGAVPWPRR